MRVGLYTTSVSPHQLPLAREIAKRVGTENFLYVYTENISAEREALGWTQLAKNEHFSVVGSDDSAAKGWIEECELLLVDLRDFELVERRLRKGLRTYYMSERWWKPMPVKLACFNVLVGGWVRMLIPRYYQMCKRTARLFAASNFRYLPVGPWAKRDMMAICKWFTGETYDEKMIPWGYFVAPSEDAGIGGLGSRDDVLKVLWVGRMVKLKRVDTIIRAIRQLGEGGRRVELTLVGDGPEKKNLLRLAQGLPVCFVGKKSAAEVRKVIRCNDVLVFSSNGMDGWGAVVNEALEEGIAAVGTYETGASAALLPASNLYHCGDVKGLVKCLERFVRIDMPYDYTAKGAAERVMAI